MAKPVARAARLLALNEQLHRIEQWRLSDLEHRGAEVAAEQEALIAALNGDSALQGLFIAATARRLGRLAQEAETVARQAEAQAAQVVEQGARVIGAERHHAAVAAAARREGEAVALRDVLEAVLARDAPASRKIDTA